MRLNGAVLNCAVLTISDTRTLDDDKSGQWLVEAIAEAGHALAERALGYVIAAGLKIFALAVVVSFAFAILPSLELSEELTLTEAFTVIGTALTAVTAAVYFATGIWQIA